MTDRKEEVNTSSAEACHPGRYLEDSWPFDCFLSSPASMFYKRNRHPDPIRWLFLRPFLSSSPSAGGSFIGLSCAEQSELGLSNIGSSVVTHSGWGILTVKEACRCEGRGLWEISVPSSQ